jgi:hypothetical protein
MTEEEVRERARAVADALVAGDIGQVVSTLSDELQRNPGEVVAILPLPAIAAEVARIEGAGGGAAYVVVLDVTSETEHLELQTRWKDRNGEPRIVEVSHISRRAREAEAEAVAAAADAEAGGADAEPGDQAGGSAASEA